MLHCLQNRGFPANLHLLEGAHLLDALQGGASIVQRVGSAQLLAERVLDCRARMHGDSCMRSGRARMCSCLPHVRLGQQGRAAEGACKKQRQSHPKAQPSHPRHAGSELQTATSSSMQSRHPPASARRCNLVFQIQPTDPSPERRGDSSNSPPASSSTTRTAPPAITPVPSAAGRSMTCGTLIAFTAAAQQAAQFAAAA